MIVLDKISRSYQRYQISRQKKVKLNSLKHIFFEQLSISTLLLASIIGITPLNEIYYLEGCTSFNNIPLALPVSICIAFIVSALLGLSQILIKIIRE
jgi:hypothetical protein